MVTTSLQRFNSNDIEDSASSHIKDDPEGNIGGIGMDCDYKHIRKYAINSSLARSDQKNRLNYRFRAS